MKVSGNLEPSGSTEVDPLIMNLKHENSTNQFLSKDFRAPTYSLVPVIKSESDLESAFEGAVKSEFMHSENSGCEEIQLNTNLIKIENDFTETLDSFKARGRISTLRSYLSSNVTNKPVPDEKSVLVAVLNEPPDVKLIVNRGTLSGFVSDSKLSTSELIVSNCDGSKLPARKSHVPRSTSTQTRIRTKTASSILTPVIKKQGAIKAKHKPKCQPSSSKRNNVGVVVPSHVNWKQRFTRSSMRLQTSEEIETSMKECLNILNPSEEKCATRSSTRLKFTRQVDELSAENFDILQLNESECPNIRPNAKKQTFNARVKTEGTRDTGNMFSDTAIVQVSTHKKSKPPKKESNSSSKLVHQTRKNRSNTELKDTSNAPTMVTRSNKKSFVKLTKKDEKGCSATKNINCKLDRLSRRAESFMKKKVKEYKVILSSHHLSKKQVLVRDKIYFIPGKGWGCDICGKFLCARAMIEKHKKIMHYQLDEIVCQICQKVFNSIARLEHHLKNCESSSQVNKLPPRNSSVSKSVNISKVMQKSSSTETSLTTNGFPMPIIVTKNNKTSQSKRWTDKKSCPSTQENVNCNPVRKIQKNLLKMKKFTHPRNASFLTKENVEVHDVTFFSHRLSTKPVAFKDKIHFVPGKGWGCDICGKFRAKRTFIMSHKKNVHHQLDKIVCQIFQQIFKSINVFKYHRFRCGNQSCKCRVCGKVCFSIALYERHYTLHHLAPTVFTCIECTPPKQLDTRKELSYHILRQHVDKYKYTCKMCGTLITNKCMKKHLRSHEKKKLKCQICSKHFSSKTALKDHLRSHNTLKNAAVICRYCHKGFKSKPELLKHSKEHEDERRFTCEHCGKGFFTIENLKFHSKSHEEKRFNCAKCNQSFVHKHQLTAHLGTIACGINSKTVSKKLKKERKNQTRNKGKKLTNAKK